MTTNDPTSSTTEPGAAHRGARHVVLGAGPVGRAIVAELVANGHRPTVITRSGTQLLGADARRADATDPAALRHALEGAAAELHDVSVSDEDNVLHLRYYGCGGVPAYDAMPDTSSVRVLITLPLEPPCVQDETLYDVPIEVV